MITQLQYHNTHSLSSLLWPIFFLSWLLHCSHSIQSINTWSLKTLTNENLHHTLWNYLSTKITYMEIWKARLARHMSHSTSLMLAWNSAMALSPHSLKLNSALTILSFKKETHSPIYTHSPTHTLTLAYTDTDCFATRFLVLPLLTCFQGCGALLSDDRTTAYHGAGAQVELILAHRLQVSQHPLGGVWVANINSL